MNNLTLDYLTSKQSSSMKFFIVFILLFTLACNNTSNKDQSQIDAFTAKGSGINEDSIQFKKMVDSIKLAHGDKPGKPLDIKPLSKWVYDDEVDKMTSKITQTATLDANEELQFDFPYEGGSTATIELRNRRGSTNVILLVSKGQFNTSIDGEHIKVRFDEGKMEIFSCSSSNDGNSRYLFINGESRFISKLKKAKKLLVEAEFYKSGYKDMEFEVSGLQWK